MTKTNNDINEKYFPGPFTLLQLLAMLAVLGLVLTLVLKHFL